MKVQNLTRGQKLFRTLTLDVLLLLCLWGIINSFSYLAVTGQPMFWFAIIVSVVLTFIVLKLRPFDDPYRTAVRSLINKC